MAASFNKVILVGNLVANPELRYVGTGSAVCKFRLAVNSTKRDATSADALFVDIIAWEKLAETCNTYLAKGSPVLVEGRLSIRQYENKQGEKCQTTEIVIYTMQMLGNKPVDESTRPSNQTFDHLDEDEIPF